VWGPLQASFASSLVRLAPLAKVTGDEGCDGLFRLSGSDGSSLVDADGSQGNRFLDRCALGQIGERQARTRLDIRPGLSANVALGRFATINPYLALRQDVYFSEGNEGIAQRGYYQLGAQLSSELSKTFYGAGAQWRHNVTPVTEVRFLSTGWGGVPGASLDEIDSARRRGFKLQALAEARQTFSRRRGKLTEQVRRFDVGQDIQLLDLSPGYREARQDGPAAADSYVRVGYSQGPARLFGVLRYDWFRRAFSQVSTTASVDIGRGSALYVSYDRLFTGGTDRTQAAIDELFVRNIFSSGQAAEQLAAGFRVALPFGFSGRYEALLTPAYSQLWRQMSAGVSYGPACDCWRLEFGAVIAPGGGAGEPPIKLTNFGAVLTISGFGSFGSGG